MEEDVFLVLRLPSMGLGEELKLWPVSEFGWAILRPSWGPPNDRKHHIRNAAFCRQHFQSQRSKVEGRIPPYQDHLLVEIAIEVD